ncbi:NDUFAF7 [Cordylochernes scorpioides]|uniref:Protein arginine methyltransferase NDUFAF7 n=1 Tax=Cordylochernes scorpioides TaxID=51811 RepID=A0ABY6LEG9_9ARAC|nr:NDUFAF7 [Cordylochernes scorpioides]
MANGSSINFIDAPGLIKIERTSESAFGMEVWCHQVSKFLGKKNGLRTFHAANRDESMWLNKYIISKIKTTGPISVDEYTKEALTNPRGGYYITQDSIGEKGDFTTSPEVSQMFGELVGVWFLNEWNKIGQPKPLQVIELGAGRGTLMDDMLRVFKKVPDYENNISVHIVEVSEKLRKEQKRKLGYNRRLELSKYKVPIKWYSSLDEVPKAFSFIVANEFFDALPINKFHKQDGEWYEMLVDVDNLDRFRYVLFKTLKRRLIDKDESRNHVEICTEGGVMVQKMAARIKEKGGLALIIDYGHQGTKEDTFRAFRRHKLADPLVNPGTCDLTADVDFKYLTKCVADHALVYGPVTQSSFLKNMGIQLRLERLLRNAPQDSREQLISGYHQLVDEDKMGSRFKVMALYPPVLTDLLKTCPPAGFSK